jgi:hypothetical protein
MASRRSDAGGTEKKRQKDEGKNIKTGDFFASIFLPAVFFLGSPGTGKGMRGRGMISISCLFRIPLSFFCQTRLDIRLGCG